MEGMFSAFPAVFVEIYFFGGINLVSFRQIILAFANRTNKGKCLTSAFFSHI
jgi:hypothetical protein